MAEPTDAQDRMNLAMQGVGDVLRHFFRRKLRQMGLTVAGSRALSYLEHNEGAAQRNLADLLEIQPITMARTLDALERDGLVERRHSATDRRVWLLYLTPAGRKMLKKSHGLSDAMAARVMVGLDEKKLVQAAELLETIERRLRELTPPRTGQAPPPKAARPAAAQRRA